jgi:hypothetical protein
MSPKYDLGTGVDWPETLELSDRDPIAYPDDGLKGWSFPMLVNIAVAGGGEVCSVDLDREAATTLHGWLTDCLAFIGANMDAVPDPGFVEPDSCRPVEVEVDGEPLVVRVHGGQEMTAEEQGMFGHVVRAAIAQIRAGEGLVAQARRDV